MTDDSGNLGDVIAALRNSDRLAVTDLHDLENPRDVTFAELNAAADAVANGLLLAGLQPGDRVGILALNRIEFLEVLFGAMRAGCVPVMINVKLPADTIRFIINDSGARIVFADVEFSGQCPHEARVVTFGTEGADGYAAFSFAGEFTSYFPGRDEIAEQPYTSGSTGRPKGVLLSHAGQLWMTDALVRSRDMSPDDCSVISAPLYHKNALLAVKSALAVGGRLVIFARFDAQEYIRAIERYRLTILTGVPTMYALILQQGELLARTDVSSVRACSMGSAPASDNLLDNLAMTFPGAALNLNYGVTEGGPILFSWKHPDELKRPRMTVGYPLDGVEIRLVGGPNDGQGVIHVRCPGVMAGYHNLPDETAACLKDGWFDTGDILRRDSDGWYYFVGRADDMFVCAGENIYPGEVEAMIERHPAVQQAVVVPAPNELKAHVPFAFVVKMPGADLDEETVKQHALDNGPAYAHPRRVLFIDALPLSGTNKIDRKGLERQAADIAGA